MTASKPNILLITDDQHRYDFFGGAPVTQAYAAEIGADGYAPDASSAVRKAKELLDVGI